MNVVADFFTRNIVAVYFVYGLAFFCMGLAVLLESERSSEMRLVRALRPLALFGLMHGVHEWGEMFGKVFTLTSNYQLSVDELILRHVWLAASFLALAVFGMQLIVPDQPGVPSGRGRPLVWQVPLLLGIIWLGGLPLLWGATETREMWLAAINAWVRYTLAVPASLLAAWGLVQLQHEFREQGLARFGRDSLWAAVAFGWYGLVGQVFITPSIIPPSNVINSELFVRLFDIPIELFRALAASAAAFFVLRFLRAFEVERVRRLQELQEGQLRAIEERQELRGDLLRQIVTAQEAERQRIARELHDETGQALTGLGLGLRGIQSLLRAGSPEAARHAEELEAMAGHAIDELRRLVADLRPSHLDDLGLVPALRWYVQDVEARSGLSIRLETLCPHLVLTPEVSTVLFRIAQEALTNVVRHARAQHAIVRLTCADREIRLTVADDGRGFAPEHVLAPQRGRQAWGLVGMQERAALVGGYLDVQSAPGSGTQVSVVVPMETEVDGRKDQAAAG